MILKMPLIIGESGGGGGGGGVRRGSSGRLGEGDENLCIMQLPRTSMIFPSFKFKIGLFYSRQLKTNLLYLHALREVLCIPSSDSNLAFCTKTMLLLPLFKDTLANINDICYDVNAAFIPYRWCIPMIYSISWGNGLLGC